MKNKCIILGITGILLMSIGGIYIYQSEDNKYIEDRNNQDTKKENKTVYDISYDMDMLEDVSNKEVINRIYDYIAIIRVKSIDSVKNVDEITNENTLVYTKGTAEVLHSIKGNIQNDTISFMRVGGSMPWDEWIKNELDADKLLSIAQEHGYSDMSNVVVRQYAKGDISIDKGKCYIVFMTKDEYERYNVVALQYGTREVQPTDATVYLQNNISEIKVKNNVTGKWESISNVVDFNINK